MYFDQAVAYAQSRLENELSPELCYHGPFHTRDEVVPATRLLAEMEKVRGQSRILLLTAAWFHDIGYVEQPVHHELIGVRIAQEVLPGFGYGEKQIETVRWAILATALPQAPQSHLEQILADADLDVLGRQDFLPRNRDLRQELASLGKTFTDDQWYTGQLRFIREHRYFTQSARFMRDEQKAVNIRALESEFRGLASAV